MPREDIILFIDLETTGSDKKLDDIIEVGLCLVDTTEGFPERAALSIVVEPSDAAYNRMMANDVVRKMHEDNGLLHDIQNNNGWQKIGWVDDAIVRWLDTVAGEDTTHIPYGGSGVMHFDRPFIQRDLPKLDKRITHWAHDVGPLRRAFIVAGVPYASIDAKTHRALDDARVHADEFRWYQRFIRGEE